MFVRRKPNKSGKISVQVIDKSSGKYKVVKTIGSSDSEPEVLELVSRGKKWISDRQGQQLDFDNTVASAKQFLSNISLVDPCGNDIILGKIYDEIGFSSIKLPLFRSLVISRIVFPCSKLKTTEHWFDHGKDDVDVVAVYRMMDKLYKLQDQVQQISYQHTVKVLGSKPSLLFYDVTTLYFEIEKEDDFRKPGFSKDGKHQNPQIVLGLLVSKGGYPLSYSIFEGNKFEGHTMLPVLEAFKEQFSLNSLTVVADSGLLSKSNVEALEQAGFEYILGGRIKNEPASIKEEILALSLKNGQAATLKKDGKTKLIVHYSLKRAKKDKYNRERGRNRLEKQISTGKLTKSNINNRGYNKYLKMDGKINISIDEGKFEADGKWDGLKGYQTNSQLSPDEILENYSELWKIEKAFRISKHDLKIRPIFHRARKRIESHICLSFTAYKVYKELERILQEKGAELSADKVIQIAQTIYKVEVNIDQKQKVNQILTLNEKQSYIRKLFDF